MADPETDRCDIYEAEKALGGLVVTDSDTSGVFQLVEAPFDKVVHGIERVIAINTHLA